MFVSTVLLIIEKNILGAYIPATELAYFNVLFAYIPLFQMLGSPENKPAFLSDKNLQPAIDKVLLRKFPNYDNKANQVTNF